MAAAAQASDDGVRVLTSKATGAVLAELAGLYTRHSGVDVRVESAGGVDVQKRVAGGEAVDVVVLAASALAELAHASRILPGAPAGIARSDIVIAVPLHATHPPIGSEQAVRNAVLDGGRIGYSTGPSGTHVLDLLDRWHVRDSVSQRLVLAPPGVGVAMLLARGEADLGFQQRSEFIAATGIEIVGPLPPAIQLVTVFAAAVGRQSTKRAAAEALIAWLASSATDAVKRRHGLEPCTPA